MQRTSSERGQASTEYMLLVSVIVIAVVAAAYTFVEPFRGGVASLAADASRILSTGSIGPVGLARKGGETTAAGEAGGLDSSGGGAPSYENEQPDSTPPPGDLGIAGPSAPNTSGMGGPTPP